MMAVWKPFLLHSCRLDRTQTVYPYDTVTVSFRYLLKQFHIDLQALSIFLCIKVALVTDHPCGCGGFRTAGRHHSSVVSQVYVHGV